VQQQYTYVYISYYLRGSDSGLVLVTVCVINACTGVLICMYVLMHAAILQPL